MWKIRTGATWRDVPDELCSWKTAYNRFNRWTQKGLWNNFFAIPKEADTEWVFIDGSHVRVHQHASGSRRGECRAIGKSSGGPTTKIHMDSDVHGNPLCIEITGGKCTIVKLHHN